MTAKRRLGQHFLHDQRVLHAIVKALDLGQEDRVVEIGAGAGVLTRQIASRAGGLVAIELDDRLAERLEVEFKDDGNVEILHANALDIDPCTLRGGLPESEKAAGYKLAGNIPYYITGALMRHYLDTQCRPSLAVLMIQLEVAQRILAGPGDMNMLAIGTQLYADPSLVTRVPPSAFRPRPKVESAVITLNVLPQPRIPLPNPDAFFTVVRAGFGMRRKQLINSLSRGLGMEKEALQDALLAAGVVPSERAEDLSLDHWGRLTDALIRQGQVGHA